MLAAAGFPTIDADSLAKHIAAADARAVDAIKAEFGDEMYSAGGDLQRHLLAQQVFGDQAALQKLNAILHPLVFEYVEEEVHRLARTGQRLVIIEAALFYESGWDRDMDAMVVVTAPLEKRLAWLQKRDGTTAAAIESRMVHQMPVEEKARRADYVIDNSGRLEDLHASVQRLIEWLETRLHF